jgi:DNA-binding transcriptional LysR family regulator
VEAVYSDPLIGAFPRGHRLATRGRVALADLAEEPFIFLPRTNAPELFDQVIARCRAAKFSPRIVQEAMAWHTVVSLVSAGVGVAFVPRSLRWLRQPGVVYRPVRDLRTDMTLWAVWKRDERSPVRQRFVTALKTVARAKSRARSQRSS